MNKKAIATYFVALAIMVAVSLYIYYYATGVASRPSPVTISYTTTVAGAGFATTTTQENGTLTCTPGTEYSCTDPVFNASTSHFYVGLTQETGGTWQTARVFFLNASEILNINQYGTYAATGNVISGVAPGATYVVTINVTSARLSPDSVYGQVWAQYQLQGSATQYYGLVGTVQ